MNRIVRIRQFIVRRIKRPRNHESLFRISLSRQDKDVSGLFQAGVSEEREAW